MSGVHKYPTISFRISPRERDEIEAKIKASGMQKKDYFVRSCIYNKVCVVGKKEVIYQLVEELQLMQYNIAEILKQFEEQEILLSDEGLEQMKNDCLDMLKAIIWMLDGAKYLWQGTEKSPDSGNCFIGWAIMKLRQTNCWEESPRKQIKRSGQNNSFMNWQKQTAW